MKITIEPAAQEELILRCPDPDAPQIQALLRLLADERRRIPARREQALFFLAPSDILYAEHVDRSVYLYTADAVYATPLSLAELEAFSLLRCAKAMVVRIDAIYTLQSRSGGRLLATLCNGEQLWISRHYAAALRRALLHPG